MKKINIVGATQDSEAGSKGLFVKNTNKMKKINIVGAMTDSGAGSKGLFVINK